MGMKPKGLPDYVIDWDDGRAFGDSIIVTLSGRCYDYPDSGVHVAGFDNVKDARQGVNTVNTFHCGCEVCAERRGMD